MLDQIECSLLGTQGQEIHMLMVALHEMTLRKALVVFSNESELDTTHLGLGEKHRLCIK